MIENEWNFRFEKHRLHTVWWGYFSHEQRPCIQCNPQSRLLAQSSPLFCTDESNKSLLARWKRAAYPHWDTMSSHNTREVKSTEKGKKLIFKGIRPIDVPNCPDSRNFGWIKWSTTSSAGMHRTADRQQVAKEGHSQRTATASLIAEWQQS